MKQFRLTCALALAILGAAAMAEAKGKPSGVPSRSAVHTRAAARDAAR